MSFPKKRQLIEYIDEIKQATADIKSFTNDLSYEQFTSNRMAMLATLKAVEVIGQACWEVREHYRDFLERDQSLLMVVNQARAMRNRTAHNYNATDYRLVYGVKDAAPHLLAKMENAYQIHMIGQLSKDGLSTAGLGVSLQGVKKSKPKDPDVEPD
mgnify:CR=1 FL=1